MAGGDTEITLLGRVAIGPVAPRGRRAELVVAYLVAEHGRQVSHDELADALWPEGLPDSWEAALRGVLTEVRRLLADAGLDPATVLTTGRRGYEVRLPPAVSVDLDEARDSLASARGLLGAGAALEAAEAAARAAVLARLPFLPDHEGDWTDRVRTELASTAARALEVEARARAAAGDHGGAATAAAALVAAEPFNEANHQLRIRLLGAAGDRAGAIRAYEHCRTLLADELGVAPSPETDAAYLDATSAPAVGPVVAPAAVDPAAALSMLVVEDHDFQRRTAVMLLRKLGVGSVAEAADGFAALDLLATSSPDVILCDIDMPGMDGIEFIRRVAQADLARAVIIASGLDPKVIQAVQAVSEGYGLQVLGAVEKPLTARRLGELLTAYRPRRSLADAATQRTPAEVRRAFEGGSIGFRLRPAVEVATGGVVAAAVEAHWAEPGGGEVAASSFVPVLEREGLGDELAAHALEAGAAAAARLGAAGIAAGVGVGVALGPGAASDPDLAEQVIGRVRAGGAEPSTVTFAVDERALRAAPAAVLGLLTRLRVKGFGVAVAGFGAARSPASVLAGLPLTEVHLAPQLLHDAVDDPSAAAALDQAVESIRDSGVVVVGTGCDTPRHLEVLLSVGCDRLQGGAVARAVGIEELPSWLAGWDPTRMGTGSAG